MADNVQASARVGDGATFATDEDATQTPVVHYPISKLAFGALNTFTLVSTSNGLPVQGIGTFTVAGTGTFAVTQSGTWTLGANSGVDIGDVDVTSVIPGTGATNLGKAEDGAHTTGDVGVMALAVRSNTAASTSGADGDYQPLITNTTGHLWVDASGQTLTVGTHAVTQSGTWNVGTVTTVTTVSTVTAVTDITGGVVPGTDAADLGKAEDAAHTTGDTGVAVLAVRRDSAAVGSGTDGDYSTINVDGSGRLWCNVNNTVTVGSHDVTNAGTFAVQAAQSGTWNVGTVTTVTTVSTVTNVATIGTSVTPGTSAAHLGKAEDGAHSSGDTGVAVLAVRRDSAAVGSDTDGDYSTLNVDGSGRLWCNVNNTVTVGSHAVTNAGTFAVQVDGSALTSLQLIDDVIFTDDAAFTPATSKVAMVGAEFDDTLPDSVDEGDAGALRMSSRRELYAQLRDAAGGERGANVNASGQLAVAGPVTNAGTFAVQVDGSALTALQLIDDIVRAEDEASAGGHSGAVVLARRTDTPANQSGTDGDYEFLQVSAGRLWASATIDAALPTGTNVIGAVTQSGTWNVGTVTTVTTVSTVTTCSTVTTLANGQTAHDSATTGSPLRVGAKAETALSGITLVADGDATDLYAGVDGVLIVRPHCNLEDVVQERATNTDGASTAFASGLAAPGANVRLWITSVTICNSSATFCTVDLRDGAAGSVLWTFPVPATGGVTHTFNPPLKLTANTALAYDASAATSTLTISALGFKSKV